MENSLVKYTLGICNEDSRECEMLREMIENIFFSLNSDVEIEIYYSCQMFIENLKAGTEYDFVILNFKLCEYSGMSLGELIRNRETDFRTQIIYVLSERSNDECLFSIQPLGIWIRPLSCLTVGTTIQKGIRLFHNKKNYFYYQKVKEVQRVLYSRIIYLYSRGRQVYIVTANGESSFYGQLKKIEQNLPRFFQRIHQSYIININMVDKYSKSEAIMVNGVCLSISRPYRNNCKLIDSRISCFS